jgi:hypothetical protein
MSNKIMIDLPTANVTIEVADVTTPVVPEGIALVQQAGGWRVFAPNAPSSSSSSSSSSSTITIHGSVIGSAIGPGAKVVATFISRDDLSGGKPRVIQSIVQPSDRGGEDLGWITVQIPQGADLEIVNADKITVKGQLRSFVGGVGVAEVEVESAENFEGELGKNADWFVGEMRGGRVSLSLDRGATMRFKRGNVSRGFIHLHKRWMTTVHYGDCEFDCLKEYRDN